MRQGIKFWNKGQYKHLQLDDHLARPYPGLQFRSSLGRVWGEFGEGNISYCLWGCVLLVVFRLSGMFDTLQAFPESS